MYSVHDATRHILYTQNISPLEVEPHSNNV